MSKPMIPKRTRNRRDADRAKTAERLYQRACQFAVREDAQRARHIYEVLERTASDSRLKAIVLNDLAALAAAAGDRQAARHGFQAALAFDQGCEPARQNLSLIDAGTAHEHDRMHNLPEGTRQPATEAGPIKVAILSFLFNWPSSGGGNVHTAELARFLIRAGYEVRHLYARYEPWQIGQVTEALPYASQALEFDASAWNVRDIQTQFRHAVDAFTPDHVIITDAWNFKPHLAEAVRGYPYILRFQAMECLCPLNNVRLLPEGNGRFRQCQLHQLATPRECASCIRERGHLSGELHQAERALSRVDEPDYHDCLLRALRDAEAMLVVNPLMEAMVSPYASHVRVVTAGMDPARFPWPVSVGSRQATVGSRQAAGTDQQSSVTSHQAAVSPNAPTDSEQRQVNSQGSETTDRSRRTADSNRSHPCDPPLTKGGPGGVASPRKSTVMFAGMVEELMKGYAVLHEACAQLWQRRQDFELVATGDPPGQVDAFTRFVGWLSQEELPGHMRAADICVVPTIAQEALGRTAVEAMAAGRPVIASRLGGLPFTVVDGATGVLCEPEDVDDLARKIETLLDDPELRERMGLAGRRRFEEKYSWDVIIEQHYRPLLSRRTARPAWGLEKGVGNPLCGAPPGPFQQKVPPVLQPVTACPVPPHAGCEHDGRHPVPSVYAPFIPLRVNQERLVAEVCQFLGLERLAVEAQWRSYRAFHEAKGYARTLGELKTLCFEEAFLIYCLLQAARPRTIVEIGTQYGKSTRRIIDIKNMVGLDSRVITFDVANQVQYFQPGEAELVLEDLTGRFRQVVLEAYDPGLIFFDVHLYRLLKEVVTEVLRDGAQGTACSPRSADMHLTAAAADSGAALADCRLGPGWFLAMHDCSPGLCNPSMSIDKDDPAVTSLTGVWERHVLAEVFGVGDPLSERLDKLETPTHRLQIFGTPHGLGVIAPRDGQGGVRDEWDAP